MLCTSFEGKGWWQGPTRDVVCYPIEERIEEGPGTYVAALIEIKEGQSMEVPDSVVKLLKEFRDVMPAKLSKELPPRRPIDHKIKLLPGTKPRLKPLTGCLL